MMIFNVALFGYMVLYQYYDYQHHRHYYYQVVLIFVKWSINWDQRMALGSCAYDYQVSLSLSSLSSFVIIMLIG